LRPSSPVLGMSLGYASGSPTPPLTALWTSAPGVDVTQQPAAWSPESTAQQSMTGTHKQCCETSSTCYGKSSSTSCTRTLRHVVHHRAPLAIAVAAVAAAAPPIKHNIKRHCLIPLCFPFPIVRRLLHDQPHLLLYGLVQDTYHDQGRFLDCSKQRAQAVARDAPS